MERYDSIDRGPNEEECRASSRGRDERQGNSWPVKEMAIVEATRKSLEARATARRPSHRGDRQYHRKVMVPERPRNKQHRAGSQHRRRPAPHRAAWPATMLPAIAAMAVTMIASRTELTMGSGIPIRDKSAAGAILPRVVLSVRAKPEHDAWKLEPLAGRHDEREHQRHGKADDQGSGARRRPITRTAGTYTIGTALGAVPIATLRPAAIPPAATSGTSKAWKALTLPRMSAPPPARTRGSLRFDQSSRSRCVALPRRRPPAK